MLLQYATRKTSEGYVLQTNAACTIQRDCGSIARTRLPVVASIRKSRTLAPVPNARQHPRETQERMDVVPIVLMDHKDIASAPVLAACQVSLDFSGLLRLSSSSRHSCWLRVSRVVLLQRLSIYMHFLHLCKTLYRDSMAQDLHGCETRTESSINQSRILCYTT